MPLLNSPIMIPSVSSLLLCVVCQIASYFFTCCSLLLHSITSQFILFHAFLKKERTTFLLQFLKK
ncbi:hypothetical protein I79_024696 [Cricetulus griseus]|uniref:Uncharacterized protein n=1 Tax=Cricetulus griseus TaxID=10029 RepID=G3ILD2_CRIGR|nr:hypothetical protein I79_024696 [Cricetulus griseus]